MRLIVFFDLPTETAAQRRQYRQFRKRLIKEGYLMLQKSVYSKLSTNEQTTQSALFRLREFRPPEGIVQVLKVTEKQFTTMAFITGERAEYDEIDTTEEILVL